MKHPDEGRLNDYADGLLEGEDAAAVAAHLGRCDPCRTRVGAIRSLTDRLAALPREISPRRDLRPPVPAGDRASRTRSATTWLRAAGLAGLLVAGAAVARLALGPGAAAGPADAGDAGAVTAVVPADAYAEATRELRNLLDARESDVPAEAARLVRRELTAVDGAIRELERASAGAPHDPDLARMLDRQYRTRLELLRSAVSLVEG